MNTQVGKKTLASKQPNDEPAQKWEELRDIFLAALNDHIPKRVQQPRKEWISPATLDLIAARGKRGKLEILRPWENITRALSNWLAKIKKHG